jgi:hypothetical protein
VMESTILILLLAQDDRDGQAADGEFQSLPVAAYGIRSPPRRVPRML